MKAVLKLRWLVIGSFIGTLGTSFIWPLTTLYLHNQLHQSLTTVGVVLLMYSGMNVVGSFLSGMLFDTIDPRKLIMPAIVIDILAMTTLIFCNNWPIYPILLAVIGFFNGWIITIINSLGTLIRGVDGRYVFNMLYFANNLGVVVGTSVVGLIYRGSVAPSFILTTVLYCGYFYVAYRFYRVVRPARGMREIKAAEHIKIPRSNLTVMWTFFIALGIVWTMYEQWVSNMSVYITGTGVSMPMYSLLWTLNAGLIAIIQLVMSRINRTMKNPYIQIYLGILFCALSFCVLIFAHTYLAFVLAMIILTLGEATAFPTIPAVVNALSPQDAKGRYQGMTNAFSSVGKAIGPLFGGLIIEISSFKGLFIVCAGAILVVNCIVILIVKLNQKRVRNF